MNGFIYLDRKILEWEWYSDINVCRLFIHILLMASWEDKPWRGQIIKRGQLVTSIPSLCAGTALTPREVRTALEKLQSTREIDRQVTSKYSVITVLNYDKYQTSDRQTTDKRQTERQSNDSLTTASEEREEIKERRNIKKIVRFAPPSLEEVKAYCQERNNGIDPESFIDFYSSKGWKVGNQPMKDWKACVRTWERRHNDKIKDNPKVHFENERQYDFDELERKLVNKRRAESG